MNSTTLTAIVRHLLGFAAGFLVSKGIELDAASIETLAGAIGGIFAVAWSLWDKKRKAAKE